jgi:hypothetical protein
MRHLEHPDRRHLRVGLHLMPNLAPPHRRPSASQQTDNEKREHSAQQLFSPAQRTGRCMFTGNLIHAHFPLRAKPRTE